MGTSMNDGTAGEWARRVQGLDAGERTQPATSAEENVISVARVGRDRCKCGGVHEDGGGITPAVVARMRAHLAENPGQQFAWDDEAGIVALIIDHPAGDPEVIAWSDDLAGLLDQVGAPAAENLS